MIHVENLTLQYRGRDVLRNVSFHVQPKQAFGIIGPSGSGKSVFLKTLAGIILPHSGNVKINSNKVSMLFQKNALFDSFTLLDNLLVPLEETIGVTGSEAEDRARSMLKAVGLEQAALLFPDEISGGMQKRLGIARALIVEPEVILYDEPTAGLDPITSKSIADLMIHLHKKNHTTLVMVTNDLQRAYQVADTIAFCHSGALETIGSPAEVKATQDPTLHRFIYSLETLMTGSHSKESLS